MEGHKAVKRISNELKQIRQNPPMYWRVVKEDDFEWTVWMDADEFTPFYGVPIKVHVKFPFNYPFENPQITFDKSQLFYHANISPSSGKICNKIVIDAPMITVRQRIQALRNLLGTPNFASYLNEGAAQMYEQDQKNDTKNWFKKALKIFRGWQKM